MPSTRVLAATMPAALRISRYSGEMLLLLMRGLRTYVRTVKSSLSVADWAWANISGAELWGALCWEVREVLGNEPADALLRETWFSLNENDSSNALLDHFPRTVLGPRGKDREREIPPQAQGNP